MTPTATTWRKRILWGVGGILFSFWLLAWPIGYLLFPQSGLLVGAVLGLWAIGSGLAISWFFTHLITKVIGRFRLIGQIAAEIDPVHPGVRIPEDDLPPAMLAVVQGLNDSWQRLEEAFHQQGRFTADASHELRTPMAIIKAQVEQALSKPRTLEEYRHILLIVQQTSLRMEDILETLLMLTRAESRTISAEFRTIPLAACVLEVVANLKPEADRLGANIRLTNPENPLSIRGDLVLVERILANLLSNALKHGLDPTRPQAMGIEVTLGEEGHLALVRVRDFGKGIAPNHKERIFERFFKGERQPPGMARKGCGLGLALAQSLAGLHKGRIVLEDVEGAGACFKVELPKWVSLHPKPDLPIESHRGSTPIWPN